MRRREFITLFSAAAAFSATLWSPRTSAQQPTRVRRVGFLIGFPADDPDGNVRITAFMRRLQELGWTDGRNVRMEFRSGASVGDRYRRYAEELVALAPDVILAGGSPSAAAMLQATQTLPIVFANVYDPVGAGYVASLSRPGGNATGFMNLEYGTATKWLQLLKQIAPRVTRVAVLRLPGTASGIGFLGAIQAAAPSLSVDLSPVGVRNADEIERGITTFVRGPTDGLIVATDMSQIQRNLTVALAARHRLPAIYLHRGFVTAGGLISYGADPTEPYRLAAGYVDRILKGEKPADLPVQAPTRYETVLNLKTARALGLEVPDVIRLRADEVIE